MKIFISWSGEQSREVAERLSVWLKCVIQACKPWVSTEDIAKGTLWFNEIKQNLDNAAIGIVCLTKENKEKPWVLFESGAMATGLTEKKVLTLLIDLDYTEVGQPLAQFNHTEVNKKEMLKLLKSINMEMGDRALDQDVLMKAFDAYWESFFADYTEILSKYKNSSLLAEENNAEFEEGMIKEILSSVRRLDKRLYRLENVKSREIDYEREIIMRNKEIDNLNRRKARENEIRKILMRDLLDRKDIDSYDERAIMGIAEKYDVDISEVYSILNEVMENRTVYGSGKYKY